MVSEPTPDQCRIGIVQRRRAQRSRRGEVELGSEPRADELNTGRGKHVGLVGAIDRDLDVDQVRQVVDGAVALILQCRGGRIGRTQALKFGVDRGNLLHVGIGLRHRVADVLLDIGAQRLNALRCRIELLRERLRRAQRRGLGRQSGRRGLKRLDRGGEIVERRFQRAGASGRAVNALKLGKDIRGLIGKTRAAGFCPQLALNERVDVTADAGDQSRGAGTPVGSSIWLMDSAI